MEVLEKSEPFDAVVVGSGATGGVAARQLTEGGLRVLVLEAGPPSAGRKEHGTFWTNVLRAVYRHNFKGRQKVQETHATYWSSNPALFIDDVDNPYTTPADKPYHWIRSRVLGGRTLLWDGVTPRMSDFEFKAASHNGRGEDWPIGHDDLAPYYADLERFLKILGSRDGLAALPDGDYGPPRPMTPGESVFKERVERAFGDRRVLISRGMQATRRPNDDDSRSYLSSAATTLAAAEQTGRLTVRSNAVVSRVLVEPDGTRARGVELVDALTGKTEEVRARVVVLCASTIESLRILMLSRSAAHPEGIGAASGVLGHYLTDHIAGNSYFYLPEVRNSSESYAFSGSDSIIIPRYRNLGDTHETYPGGFGMWGCIQRLPIPRILMKKRQLAFGFMCARAETLSHFDNRMELDPEVRDAWGIPAAHIVCEWKESDLAIAEAAKRDQEEMITAAGGELLKLTDACYTPGITGFLRRMEGHWSRSTPGLFVHEVGGARMGTSPKSSVVNGYCQSWDVKNLLVTDGACWPTSGWQNPTLTAMAITARACDHAVSELKKMNL